MRKNEAIDIVQVDNGFLVQRGARHQCVATAPDMLVFRSMAELIEFVADHFEHREGRIPVDAKR